MKKNNKIILQACLFQGSHWLILGIIIPVLVLFQQQRGLSFTKIGINMALYAGSVIILEIPSGILADYLGQKRVYILSVLLNASAMFIPVFTQDPLLISVAFIIMGAGRAFSSGSLEAIFLNRISEIGTETDMERLISWTQIIILLGLAMGALLGGLLPDLSLPQISLIRLIDKYSLNFLVVFVLGLVLAISFMINVHEHRPVEKITTRKNNPQSSTHPISLAISTIKSSRVFLVFLITSLSWGLAFSGLETFWQPRVFQITGGTGSTFIYGLLTNGYFLAGALGSLISWPLCRLLGNKPFIFLFVQRLLLGGMLFLLSGIMNMGWFSAVYIGLFLFNGISSPVEQTMLNKEIPSKSRATLLSVISFVMQTGGLTGSLVWGVLSEAKGIGFSWKVGALILIISCAAYLGVYRNKKTRVS